MFHVFFGSKFVFLQRGGECSRNKGCVARVLCAARGRRDGGIVYVAQRHGLVFSHVHAPCFMAVLAGSSIFGRYCDSSPTRLLRPLHHVVAPLFVRWALMPPKAFATDGTVMQLACLERLYKVFERC